MSALTATVAGQELRNRATAACLAEYESEHGSFTGAELRAAADAWDRAEQLEDRWRGRMRPAMAEGPART
ncbi:hypothetical protein ACLIYP_15410 [Streptomyces nanhaiensis]|uniref:hypothetical protein n=1 Tax=Streptomyces nanhaiensis TaxID=679319 RepID=UPI00399D189A